MQMVQNMYAYEYEYFCSVLLSHQHINQSISFLFIQELWGHPGTQVNNDFRDFMDNVPFLGGAMSQRLG